MSADAGFFDASFFDPRRHGEALARLASECLVRGDFKAAFRYADRRCRLFKAGAREYLMRSEASRRAGHAEFAAQDLKRALEADPTDPLVKALALSWGSDLQKLETARAIVADGESDRSVLRRAVGLLFEKDAQTLCCLTRRDGSLAGWIAWVGRGAFSLRMEAATAEVFDIAPDPGHDLAGDDWSCVEIEASCAEGQSPRLVFLLDGLEIGAFSPPASRMHESVQGGPAPNVRVKPELLNVIVPVYEDFEATRACLDALFAGTSTIATRVIVIDDASPNPGLRVWLELQAASRKIELIRNECNLGFAVSVNRALALCPDGDVLLLNADTLPPPSILDRLVEVATSRPDIGTVTPLSNNGELTSFPKPHVANPLGSLNEVARIDALARKANGAAFVDLPNGVGFCLYITRGCLDAVGPLPEIYARGYYEDVEFCLRAREKGFRNVCAVGIYVGHAGARSFRLEKRRLVMRNLKALERRFPDNALESAAYVHADPLKPWRRAIEFLAPPQGPAALLVCGEGTSGLLAREEALRRAEIPGEPTPLICRFERSGDRVFLNGVGDAGPHSLTFPLNGQGAEALTAWLRSVDLVRIEIFDPLKLPKNLLKFISLLKRPVELAAADFEWVFPSRPPAAGPCDKSAGAADGACPACVAAFSPGEGQPKRRRALPAGAQAIRPLDRMSEVFARHVFGESLVLKAPKPGPVVVASAPRARNSGALAIVAPEPSALADRLIVSLGRALLRRCAASSFGPPPIVVLGQCLDDLAIMASGNVFVAGKIETEEYEHLLRQYEVSALMSPYRTRFFGRIDYLSRMSGLPKAYFDWTFGKMTRTAPDLALDPRLCDAKAAEQIADWLAQ